MRVLASLTAHLAPALRRARPASSWFPTYFSGGSFMQVYDTDKPAPTAKPGWPAKDPETGQPLASPSFPCIIFAHTRPEWDLLDESNPATGGLRLSYMGLTEPTSDAFNACPFSDAYNGERPRRLTINLLCDPSGSSSDIKFVANPRTPTDPTTYYTEVDTCVYELTASTKAACGSAGDPFSPCSSTSAAAATQQQLQAGLPSTNFGFTVLGAVLLAVAQFAIARGALDAASAALRRAGVLKGGSGGGGSASSAAAPVSADPTPFAPRSYGGL